VGAGAGAAGAGTGFAAATGTTARLRRSAGVRRLTTVAKAAARWAIEDVLRARLVVGRSAEMPAGTRMIRVSVDGGAIAVGSPSGASSMNAGNESAAALAPARRATTSPRAQVPLMFSPSEADNRTEDVSAGEAVS
jgi:hypothetical protein